MRSASFDDYPRLAALSYRNGRRFLSEQEWRHRYLSNPAYLSLGNDWPIGWVLESAGEIVGFMANVPFVYHFMGRSLVAGVGNSWVVDRSFRSYAALFADYFLNQKTADICLGTTSNAEASQVLSTFGASRIPFGHWDRIGIWITNYAEFASAWMTRRGIPLALSRAIALPVSMNDVVHRLASRIGVGDDVLVTSLMEFDERFDFFWEQLKEENPGVLLLDRSSRALEWHFRSAIDQGQLWIETVSKDSRLVAYGIFRRYKDFRSGASRVVFVDFQALRGHRHQLTNILSRALKRGRTERLASLHVIGLCLGKTRLAEEAPYIYKRDAWSFLFKARDEKLAQLLTDPAHWAPSSLDGDTSL
jgi:hypothetical protein